MNLSTVTHEFLQPARYIKPYGITQCADFILRLTPVPDTPKVRFSSEAIHPELEPRMIWAIERGVRDFVRERIFDGQRPIGCLHVTLVDIVIHEVETKDWVLYLAAYRALQQAFAAHETYLDVRLGAAGIDEIVFVSYFAVEPEDTRPPVPRPGEPEASAWLEPSEDPLPKIRSAKHVLRACCLLVMTWLCILGFFKASGYVVASERLQWQQAYGIIGTVCLGSAGWCLRRAKKLRS